MDAHSSPEHSTEENGKRTRKPRTRFSPAQLRVLRDAFRKTLSPGWATIHSLASETSLDIDVVTVWFKNQRAKRKRTNLERGRVPAPKRRAGSKGEPCSPKHSLESSSPSSASTCSPLNLGAPLASDGEHSGGEGASPRSPALDFQPKDPLDEIQLEVSEAPWASSTQDIHEFIQMYWVPGDDDFAGLDQYLLPSLLPEDCDSGDGPSDGGHQSS